MVARAAAFAVALCAAATSSVAAQTTFPILADRDLTVAAGATVMTTAGEAAARAQAAIVPDRVLEERGVWRRRANVSYRLFKQIFADVPQERLLMVVNHEVFGHGARLRELFDGKIRYRIHAPPPYGSGGGVTTFVFDREPTPYERLVISAAGMEANAMAAALIAHAVSSRQQMHAREAIRYLLFELDTLSYIRSTGAHAEPGHDVADFLDTYNALASSRGAEPLSLRTLRRDSLLSLANPMLGYAAYSIVRYVWNGAIYTSMPVLTVAGVTYLPMLRYRLTPYGPEWALINELGGRAGALQIEFRVPRVASGWGLSIRKTGVFAWRDWNGDTSVDVWRQQNSQVGANVRSRVRRNLIPVWFSPQSADLIVEVGLKTAGFVPGEPVRGGVTVRAGVGLPLHHLGFK